MHRHLPRFVFGSWVVGLFAVACSIWWPAGTAHAGTDETFQTVADVDVFPLWRSDPVTGVRVRRGMTTSVDVGPESAGGIGERLAYSNTLGRFVAELPAGFRVSDDLTLTANDGCSLRRFVFRVTGRSRPTSCGGQSCGPFAVDYVLFDACPSAGGRVVPGTEGAFQAPDDGEYEIETVIAADLNVTLPSRVWLSVRFDRNNAGVVVGSLPLVGFSADVLDIPSFGCNGNFGGFPDHPHASFFAEVFVAAACPYAFPGYLNIRSANTGIAPGANVTVADDVELGVASCDLVALEVGVRNRGLYDAELRQDRNGRPAGGSTFGVDGIAGTNRRFLVSVDGFNRQRLVYDPPIPLPPEPLWVALRVNNDRAEWILTRREAAVGHTLASYARFSSAGWAQMTPSAGAHAGFQAVITCAGEPPAGACCDMLQTDDGGDAVCRDVPRMNCAWPPRGSQLKPEWVGGAVCAADPFPLPCGVSACCPPDDLCEDLTEHECTDIEPLELPRLWERGAYCGDFLQQCPWNACLVREGTCMTSHDGVGCSDPWCCDTICDVDPWCCQGQWDRECVRLAGTRCDTTPSFDSCYTDESRQALLVEANGATAFSNTQAEQSSSDPAFACRLGPVIACDGGTRKALACVTDRDCPQARCVQWLLSGQRVFNTVWFRFRATAESVAIGLCGSDPGLDSVVQLLGVTDDTDGASACGSLVPVACKDDSAGCSATNRHGRMCVRGLTPGALYYILVGGKTRDDVGFHKLTLRSPCQSSDRIELNDYRSDALEVALGRYPFDFTAATPEGTLDDCAPKDSPDVWYSFSPTVGGWFSVRADVLQGDPSSMAIATYLPAPDLAPGAYVHACDNGGSADPSPGAVTVPIGASSGSLIRLAHVGPHDAFGDIVIEEAQEPACRSLRLDGFDPPAGLVDARSPHVRGDTGQLAGLDRVSFAYASDSLLQDSVDAAQCWRVCETRANVPLHPPYPIELFVNEVVDLRESTGGRFELKLRRPVTPGEATVVAHIDVNGRVTQAGPIYALPGDVNGDGVASGDDILDLIDTLNAQPCTFQTCPSAWGEFSLDIDHSGALTPADVLELIDLFNGADAFAPWVNAELPFAPPSCP